jgi:hypothetical protein
MLGLRDGSSCAQRNHQVCFFTRHPIFVNFFLWYRSQFLLPRMITNPNDDVRNRTVIRSLRSQIREFVVALMCLEL